MGPGRDFPVQVINAAAFNKYLQQVLYCHESMVTVKVFSSERYLFPYKREQARLTLGRYVVGSLPSPL